MRRLASVRRSKDWLGALRVLDTVELEEGAAGVAAASWAKPAEGYDDSAWRRVWCKEGCEHLSREDAERARTRVYNIVMDVLSAKKRWREVFLLLERMQERGVATNIYTFNSLLKACGLAGQLELLLKLLGEMSLRGSDSTRGDNRGGGATGADSRPPLPAPDVVSFNIALAACARVGEASLAVSLLELMRTGTTSDSNSSSSSGSTAGATAVLAATAATAPAPPAAREGGGEERLWDRGWGGDFPPVLTSSAPRPNQFSFNSTLSACAEAAGGGEEWFQKATDILEIMRVGDGGAPPPDLVTYKEMVNACGRAKRSKQVLTYVGAAVDDGLELNEAFFCAIITAFGRSGMWRGAMSVLYEEMPRHRIQPDKFCYNMALRACADAGRIKEALTILDNHLAGGFGGNGFSYSSIIDALAKQGNSELALRLLREVEDGTGQPPNSRHYGSVFAAFLKAGDEAGALAVQSEWREIQARDATDRMTRRTRTGGAFSPGPERDQGISSGNDVSSGGAPRGNSADPRGEGGRLEGAQEQPVHSRGRRHQDHHGHHGGRVGAAEELEEHPEEQSATAVNAPGKRFDPADLLSLAAFHADTGSWADCLDVLDNAEEVSRSARVAATVKANELLLGSAERGERIGAVGETELEGAGLASWRKTAARNSEATDRADQAAAALRSCYELAVEALGRAGRWQQALEVLKVGALFAGECGLSFDPSCFVPALRSCCNGSNGDEGGGDQSDAGSRGIEPGPELGVTLLREMEARAGVVPDAWCSNVVMEAAVRDEQWSLASSIFDDAEARHLSALARRADGGEGAGSGGAGSGSGGRRPLNRGPRELIKTAVDAMAPTAQTYRLALQACAGIASSQEVKTERALSLAKKMAADPNMPPARDSMAVAMQVCALSSGTAAEVEMRQLDTEAKERHAVSDFLQLWSQGGRYKRQRLRAERQWRDYD